MEANWKSRRKEDSCFGSGEGITANHFDKKNDVTAIEPSEEMLSNAWKDNEYNQIVGDVNALSVFNDETFDIIICHNVLEYIDDKEAVVKALARVLKKDGIPSIAKHNRAVRVMQMAVLLESLDEEGISILEHDYLKMKECLSSNQEYME